MKTTRRLNLFAAVLTVLLGGNSALKGDDSVSQSPALPPGPLLSNGGDLSAWQISYSYASDNNKDAASAATPPPANAVLILPVRSITITRVKPKYHVVMIQKSGTKLEQWYDGETRFMEQPGVANPQIMDNVVTAVSPFPDFTSTDFPDMGWIDSSHYTGVADMGGRKCLVFNNGDMTAWIDPQTRFPVQWQRGTETRTFRQLPTPIELEFPPSIAKVSDGLKREINSWNRFARPQPQ